MAGSAGVESLPSLRTVSRANSHDQADTSFSNVSRKVDRHFTEARAHNDPETYSLSSRPLLGDPVRHFNGDIVPCCDRETNCR
jgi:hypothetical protein